MWFIHLETGLSFGFYYRNRTFLKKTVVFLEKISSCPAGHLRHRACCILWLVDSVVEEDPALVDSVVDPQLLSQAPGRSEGDQKLRQSRKRNHGSSLFLLCLNFGPCAVWLGPCGTSWGSTPGGVLYVPVALSLGLCFFRMKVLQKPNPQNHKNCKKKKN